ncbi:MAG: hypothetical protein FWD26_03510 [Treponema sp.]|nr:hypothetical protein [Treponema sp.]
MGNTIRIVFKILVFLVLGYIGVMCLMLGLLPGTLLMAGACIAFNFFTLPKDKFAAAKEKARDTLKDCGEKAKGCVEITGDLFKVAADTTGQLGVKACKAVGSGIESGYNAMGGREGAKKLAKKIGNAAEEAVIFGGHFIDEMGTAISKGTKEVNKQLEAKRKERRKIEAKKNDNKINDAVEAVFEILND